MSLTRIGSIGINTGIAFAGVTTIVTLNTANDALSIGSTVNVGSGITLGASGDIFATGVSTVTTLKVGSGVTVSSDGDVFATGVTTATTFSGSGASLTNLNASNIASGTVPTARLGSGTASSSTFLRGDSTFATVTSTTINNNADNRLITGSGTANTLEAESSLTFDGTNLDLGADNKKLRLGGGPDIELYTDGSHSYLNNENGNWYIHGSTGSNSQEILIRPKQAENSIRAIADGAVELYHDNTLRAYTTNVGLHVDTIVSVPDNGKFRCGNGDDLEIYHDGSNSYIKDSGTGGLLINSSGFDILNAADNEFMGRFIQDGAVELYHNSAKKFETYQYGIKTTQNIMIGTHAYWEDNGEAIFGDGSDLKIYHDGTDSRIRSSTGNLLVAVNEFKVTRLADDSTAFSVDQDGGVTLAHNHSARLSTLSGGTVMGTNYSEGTTEPFFVETGGTIRRRYSSTAGSGFHLTGGAIFATTGTGAFSNGGITWGTSSYRWGQIFSAWSNISTSDRNLKNTITTSDLGLDFVNQLKPISFKFNDGKSGRTHYGLISQDVEELLPKIGKTAMDFGGFCKDKNNRIETNDDGTDSVIEEEGDIYSLRYDEFIAPLIKAVQELSAKNDALEARIKTLEG